MTRAQLSSLAAVLGLIASCGEPPRGPSHRLPAPSPVSSTKEEAKDVAAVPEWVYSSSGKRDPFRSFLAEFDGAANAVSTRCPTPLGKFDVDQLRLVAVVTGLEDPVAMVEGPNGIGYSLRRGACIGRNGGVVAAVRSGEVVISEWAIRADGNREKTQTIMRLPKEAALNIEE